FEYEGPPPDVDNNPPDTFYDSGPIQDTLETVAFKFHGTDDKTKPEDLQFECRLVEWDPTEAPELIAPWEPIPPELRWVPCSSPWQVPMFEEGFFTFEIRAIDRAANIDPTPAIEPISGADTQPPETIIVEHPPNPSYSRTGTFSFTATDNITPRQFMEFECRIDTRDPDLWLECYNPAIFANLTTGWHTVEIRALDGGENMDPTPAKYTWRVGEPQNCDAANITLSAVQDGMVDEVNAGENYVFLQELSVASGGDGDPTAIPPEPIFGQNQRALFRFNLPNDAPDCDLQQAQLQLWNDSPSAPANVAVTPLAEPWLESTLTWENQPDVLPGAGPVVAGISNDTPRYIKWDVTDQVLAMIESGVNHGWRVSDANENNPDGVDQSFASREAPIDPPEMTLPRLILRYDATGIEAPDAPVLEPDIEPTTDIECGDVIKVDTVLGKDLEDCPGEGIVIGAPNIVLDLNGHWVDGPDYLINNISGQEEGFPAGIRNAGHSNVLITNSKGTECNAVVREKPGCEGGVKEFGYGVLLAGTTFNVVENLHMHTNAMAGVELQDADDGRNGNTIRNNFIHDNELGVTILNDSYGSLVEGNKIHGNLGEAILIELSDGHTIKNNEIVGVPFNPGLDSDGGFLLWTSSNNTIIGNVLRDTGDAGLVLAQGSDNNRIGGPPDPSKVGSIPCVLDPNCVGSGEGNKMWNNGDAGVYIQDSENNQVINNVAHQESDGGIVINGASGTIIKDNDLRFNPNGIETADSNDIVVQGN
ncbi:MAG TPA: right-handed parallel beta-helix repeat-containing protein, partial [Actinomycetota bacterium]|nr:right-handed parallel beta-helix repeat-containing protein [Actinomycetota bacterium]